MSNSNIDEVKYHEIFERMIACITDAEGFERDKFVGILADVCHLFDLCHGVTEFYTGPCEEKAGKGEILEDYNDGRKGEVILSRRIVTPQMTVIKSTVYRPADSFELTELDLKRLDLVNRTLMTFISRNRLQTEVEKLAFYDLAGYPNMNSFNRRLAELDTEKHLAGKAAVMYNLRNFSLINSDLGTETGDRIMKAYYEAVKKVIGDEYVFCRMGGDNFIAAFEPDYLGEVIQILNGYPVVYDEERQLHTMISAYAGVFVIPHNFVYSRPGEIISRLFAALGEAKTEESGTIINVEEEESSEKEKIKRIRSIFPEALEAGEFHAYYQPKVNIETGKVAGAEALCRWIQGGTIIPPDEFIPVLEQNNEICRLDLYMLETVCRDIKKWMEKGLEPVRVSVNLSRKHLSNIDLVNWLMTIVDEYGVPHEYIEFELTESATSVGISNLKKIVSELRGKGFAAAVDDFGMGYSSLNLIREIPWDVLKLDRNFLPQDNRDKSTITSLMYHHVANMAHDLGLVTVTEGVETKEQLEVLRENKCMIAQGYYFDRPMPEEDFEKCLKENYKV